MEIRINPDVWENLEQGHEFGSSCNGFTQVRNESLAPELLHAQSKRPSQYRFMVPLIVPSYSYCGLRALIEAVN